jgi:hypothetical protein
MTAERNGFPDTALVARQFAGRRAEDRALINDRIERFVAGGWRRREWRATSPGAPFVTPWYDDERLACDRSSGTRQDVHRRDDYFYREIDRDAARHHLDHEYRLIPKMASQDRRGRGTIWVTEPYSHTDGVRERDDLARALGDGWHVRVVPDATLWNPGGTTAIWMARAEVPLVPPWETDLVSAHFMTLTTRR